MNILNKENLQYLLNITGDYLVIVANGEMPKSDCIIEVIVSAKLILACDGASFKLNQLGIIPDYVIGDNDSSQKTLKTHNPYIYIGDQNSNDLSKAFHFAGTLEKNIPIIILAASGLREDHALGNIALLNQFQYKDPTQIIHMISDYGIFTPLPSGIHKINSMNGEQISFFGFNQDNQITCKELKWALDEYNLSYLNSGTLNQSNSNHLNIKTKTPILIYRCFEIK